MRETTSSLHVSGSHLNGRAQHFPQRVEAQTSPNLEEITCPSRENVHLTLLVGLNVAGSTVGGPGLTSIGRAWGVFNSSGFEPSRFGQVNRLALEIREGGSIEIILHLPSQN